MKLIHYLSVLDTLWKPPNFEPFPTETFILQLKPLKQCNHVLREYQLANIAKKP